MAAERTCPRCGTLLSSEALEGLCPKCVGRAAFEKKPEDTLPTDKFREGTMDREPTVDGHAGPSNAGQQRAGERIGRYKLLQQIGEGGFGTVWMAEQMEPVSRQVALKIIKPGMDTREVIGRFEQERQALAMMDHPNIAKVHDAGTTKNGRPFFVMELVKGKPITNYCDERQWSTRDRLKIFAEVCSAINHAHQKGIIHRDIKPSNVMVTLHGDKPVVKVIDFGIAKATQGKLTDKTVFTRFEQFIGTPVYMSPEQASMSGVDVDTRSDIYALGILLYELLTGKPPFDAKSLASAGYEEIRRIIREVEPPRPSSRLSTVAGEERTIIARARQVEPDKLKHLVEPDLDWIVMKAIEKDRTRRYETANGLALDIQRFLADEPVSATPPSAGYQFRKFARRNKVALRVAAVLAAATAVSTWQAIRARSAETLAGERLTQVTAERDQTAQARDEAEAVTQFLREVFHSPDPSRDGRTITVVEKLDQAARQLDAGLSLHPDRRAVLRVALADTYGAIGLPEQAVPLQEKARDHYLTNRGREDRYTLWAATNLAKHYLDAGRIGEALDIDTEVEQIRLRTLGPEHPDSISAMERIASSYAAAGKYKEAEQRLEKAFALRKHSANPESPEMLRCMLNLASIYASGQRNPEALEIASTLLPLSEKINGPEHRHTLAARHLLARILLKEDRRQESLPLWERTVEISKKVNGPDHPDTLKFMMGLAAGYTDSGKHEDAVRMSREIVELRSKGSSKDHPETLKAVCALGIALNMAGRFEEAIEVLEGTEAPARKIYEAGSTRLVDVLVALAVACRHTGRMEKAIALMEEIVAARRRSPGRNASGVLDAERVLKSYYDEAGRPAAADSSHAPSTEPGAPEPPGQPADPRGASPDKIQKLQISLADISRLKGQESAESIAAMTELAAAHAAEGNGSKAIKQATEALDLARRHLPAGDKRTLELMKLLAAQYRCVEMEDEAQKLEEELQALTQPANP
jgi:serine/threonine protein kinase